THRANIQSASGFRLEDFQRESAPAQMAADSRWIFRNGNFRLRDGKYLSCELHTTRSQKGKVAHGSMRTAFRPIGLLVLASLTVSARAQEVVIPDAGLNAAIRGALQKPSG